MVHPDPVYGSFLIRLWRETSASPRPESSSEPPLAGGERFDGACSEPSRRVKGRSRKPHQQWLIQVEHIPSGEKQYFGSLEDLFAFIRKWTSDHGGR